MATSERKFNKGRALIHMSLPASEDTRPFTQPWDFGDITFIVEGRKIYVNRTTLEMSSKVFSTMLNANFKEKEMTEIPLPEKKFEDFLQLMQILHPHVNKFVNDTNVDCILPLVHEYQIANVVEQCEKTLLKQHPNIHNLILADGFSLPELRKTCIDYAKRAPHCKLQMHPEFKMVEKDTLFEIFQHKSEVYEGNDPQKLSCNLMAQPPSIKNFLQAQKYDISDVSRKCLIYLLDTPLPQLKQEPSYTNLKPETLIALLNYKVNMQGLTGRGKIDSWGGMSLDEQCRGGRHITGTKSDCLECKLRSCTVGPSHRLGTYRDCPVCKLKRFSWLKGNAGG